MTNNNNLKNGKRKFFSIANLPFYYGWVILFVASIGILASIPGQTMGVSVFTDYYISNLEISRVQISTTYMIGTLASSLLIPYAGIYFDKLGARFVAAVSTLFLGLFLLLLGNSERIVNFLTNNINLPYLVIVFIVMTIGFFGIRFFGQGVLTLVSKGMVAKWFGPRRGFAVGIMGLITAFGFSFAPQPLHKLIQIFEWDRALIVIATFLIFIFLPIVILLYRADPNKYGIEVEEGMKEKKAKTNKSAMDAKVEKTVQEAKKEPLYWVILLSLGFWGMFNTAFTFHVVSIFNETGLDAEQAVRIFFPISVISVISRFLASYLSDRISIKYIYIAYISALICATLSLFLLNVPGINYLIIVAFGVAGGLFGMLNIVTWPKIYGRKHLGAISGFAMSIVVAGSAIGPWFFSIIKEFTKSYHLVGLFGMIITILFLIFVLRVDWTVEK
ncbi:MAG: MFS transporter [Pleomorphochaeta sp.]